MVKEIKDTISITNKQLYEYSITLHGEYDFRNKNDGEVGEDEILPDLGIMGLIDEDLLETKNILVDILILITKMYSHMNDDNILLIEDEVENDINDIIKTKDYAEDSIDNKLSYLPIIGMVDRMSENNMILDKIKYLLYKYENILIGSGKQMSFNEDKNGKNDERIREDIFTETNNQINLTLDNINLVCHSINEITKTIEDLI